MINFGKYTEKVSFLGFSNTSDGAGGILSNSYVVLTTFAAVNQTRTSNAIESEDLLIPNTYRVAIQYRIGFTPSEAYQVLYRTKYYKITGVQLMDERQHKEYIITMVGIL
jgi:head-tail adaptor